MLFLPAGRLERALGCCWQLLHQDFIHTPTVHINNLKAVIRPIKTLPFFGDAAQHVHDKSTKGLKTYAAFIG